MIFFECSNIVPNLKCQIQFKVNSLFGTMTNFKLLYRQSNCKKYRIPKRIADAHLSDQCKRRSSPSTLCINPPALLITQFKLHTTISNYKGLDLFREFNSIFINLFEEQQVDCNINYCWNKGLINFLSLHLKNTELDNERILQSDASHAINFDASEIKQKNYSSYMIKAKTGIPSIDKGPYIFQPNNAHTFFRKRPWTFQPFHTHTFLSMHPYAFQPQTRMYATESNVDATYNYKMIYRGELTRMVRAVKVFSLSTSTIGLILQPALVHQIQESLPIGITLACVTNVFVFATPLLLHLITKRYVIEMLYNPTTKTFIAMTLSFFLRQKSHIFTREETADPRGFHILTSLVVRDKVALFFDPAAFTDKQAYIHLMKYDEPLDWQIHRHDDDNQTNKKDANS